MNWRNRLDGLVERAIRWGYVSGRLDRLQGCEDVSFCLGGEPRRAYRRGWRDAGEELRRRSGAV